MAMSAPSRFANGARTLLAFARRRRPPPGGIVLAYHDVRPGPAVTPFDVTPARLREHLERIRASGLLIVPAAEIAGAVDRDEPLDGLAAVTFDDALAGVHRHALPVLDELGVQATIFAVAEGLGERAAWWPEAGRTMHATELEEAVAAGWSLGSHTRTHPSLPVLGDDDLEDELADSRVRLEQRFGRSVTLLAYPSGHHNARVRAAAAAAGYDAAFTFLNGRVVPGVDRYRLPRLTMDARHSRPRFIYHLFRPSDAWPDTQLDAIH
jgi:peptidoglycan/xylan/chitin deacetylase (PgdA/CDA1 family)